MRIPIISSIGRFFNSATISAAPQSAGVAPMTPERYQAANPRAELDDFELKFSLYFPNSTWRNNSFLVADRPPIPKKLIKLILSKAGTVFAGDDVARLRELRAEQQRIHDKLNELNFWASTKLWQEQQDAAAVKIMAGEPVDLKTKMQIRDSICEQRKVLHAELYPLSKSAYEILKPMCARLKSVAREMCEAQDAKERGVHDDNVSDEMSFVPSQYLRTLAFVALNACTAPIANFELTNLLSAPDPDRLIEFWFPNVEILPARPVRQPAAMHPQEIARREAESLAASERHKAAVAEKNVFIEKVQRQIAEVQAQVAENIAPKPSASGAAEIIAGDIPQKP
jgi:hypothetical protein